MPVMQQDSILNSDSVQITRANADEGVLRRLVIFTNYVKALALSFGAPEPLRRRMQELFPRVRADSETEQRLIITLLQTVAPTVLLISPTDWKVGDGIQLFIDNRVIADGRADNLISAAGERIEQLLETGAFESEFDLKLSHGLSSRPKPTAKGVPPNNSDHCRIASSLIR